MHFAPEEMHVEFLKNSANPFTPFNSKAIGEPPFMYGIGAYFALLNAIKAFRPEKRLAMSAPLTPERALRALYESC
jgi:xanthine dehydrogenase large subunit